MSQLIAVTKKTDLTRILLLHCPRVDSEVNRGLCNPTEADGDGRCSRNLVVAHEVVRHTRFAIAYVACVTGGGLCRTAAIIL